MTSTIDKDLMDNPDDDVVSEPSDEAVSLAKDAKPAKKPKKKPASDKPAVGTKPAKAKGDAKAKDAGKAATAKAATAKPVEAAPAPAQRPSTGLLVGIAFVGLIVVAALVALSLAWHNARSDVRELRALDADRTAALVAGKQYALDFSTYDYRKLDENFALVKSHLTKEFAEQYDVTTKALKETLIASKGTATATIEGAAVASSSHTEAVVLVFLNQQVTNNALKAPRLDANRLQLTLVKQDAQWLVKGIELK